MRTYKRILSILIAGLAILSCEDDSTDRMPLDEIVTSSGGIIRQVEVVSPIFNFFDLDNAAFVITIEVDDAANGAAFESVEFLGTFRDNTEDNGTVDLPEASVVTVPASSFTNDASTNLPRTTVTITFPQAAAAIGVTKEDVDKTDQFIFRQVLKLKNGKTYTISNSSAALLAGAFYASPFRNSVGVSCPSDIGGDVEYTTVVTAVGDGGDISGCDGAGVSGTATLEAQPGGKYAVSDITFGQYDCAWGDSPAAGVTLVDLCEFLYLEGADQYGLIYTIEIVSNDGTSLVLNWSNDYGDAGTTTLVRADGSSWPLGLYTE